MITTNASRYQGKQMITTNASRYQGMQMITTNASRYQGIQMRICAVLFGKFSEKPARMRIRKKDENQEEGWESGRKMRIRKTDENQEDG